MDRLGRTRAGTDFLPRVRALPLEALLSPPRLPGGFPDERVASFLQVRSELWAALVVAFLFGWLGQLSVVSRQLWGDSSGEHNGQRTTDN